MLFKKIAQIMIYIIPAVSLFAFNIKTYDVFLSAKGAFFFAGVAMLSWLFFKKFKLNKTAFFFFLIIPALLFVSDYRTGWFFAKRALIPVIAFFIYLILLFSSKIDRKKYGNFLVLLLFLHFLYSAAQALGIDFHFWSGWAGRGKIFTTIGNPNFSSVFNGMFSIILLYRGLKKRNLIYLLLSVISFVMVLVAGSRGVMLSVVVISLFIFKGKKNLIYLIAATLSILLFLFIRPDIFYRIKTSVRFGQGSVMNRILVYKITADEIMKRPFLGYGFASFQMNYLDAQGRYFQYLPATYYSQSTDAKHTHNEYLQGIYELGVIGFAAVLTIFIYFYKRINEKEWRYALWIILGQSFFSFPLHIIPHLVFFVSILSMQKPETTQISPKKWVYIIFALLASIAMFESITYYQSNILLRKGLRDNNSLIKAVRLNDTDGVPSAMLGLHYLNNKRYAEAKPFLLKSSSKLRDAENYNNLGLVFDGLGQWKLSEFYYRKTLFVMPGNLITYQNLALLYLKMGQMDRLKNLLNVMSAAFPDKSATYLLWGNFYIAEKKYEKAIENYRYGSFLDENNIKLLYNIGVAYYYNGDKEDALKYFMKVKEISPDYHGINRVISIVKRKL